VQLYGQTAMDYNGYPKVWVMGPCCEFGINNTSNELAPKINDL